MCGPLAAPNKPHVRRSLAPTHIHGYLRLWLVDNMEIASSYQVAEITDRLASTSTSFITPLAKEFTCLSTIALEEARWRFCAETLCP